MEAHKASHGHLCSLRPGRVYALEGLFFNPFLLQCVVIRVQMWQGGNSLEPLAGGCCAFDGFSSEARRSALTAWGRCDELGGG